MIVKQSILDNNQHTQIVNLRLYSYYNEINFAPVLNEKVITDIQFTMTIVSLIILLHSLGMISASKLDMKAVYYYNIAIFVCLLPLMLLFVLRRETAYRYAVMMMTNLIIYSEFNDAINSLEQFESYNRQQVDVDIV